MKLGKLMIIIGTVFGIALSAHARKPAVEDFVGVETESYAKGSPGTEVLFEFGNSVKAVKAKKITSWEDYVPGLVLGAFLLLPFAMWTAITRSAGKLDSVRAQEQANNVAKLSDYAKASSEQEEKDEFKQAG